MKRKILLPVILLLIALNGIAQSSWRIRGKVTGAAVPDFELFYAKGRTYHAETIKPDKNGAFHYQSQPNTTAAIANISINGFGRFPLFMAPGYDLYLEADISRRTIRIRGKGGDVNAYTEKLTQLMLSGTNALNWRQANETAFLKHLSDSISSITTFDRAFGAANTDRYKDMFKTIVLRERDARKILDMYRYAFLHHYTHAQTTALIQKAGIAGDGREQLDFRQHRATFLMRYQPLRKGQKFRENYDQIDAGALSRRRSLDADHFNRLRAENRINLRFDPNSEVFQGNLVPTGGKYPVPGVLIRGRGDVEVALSDVDRKTAVDFRYRILTGADTELTGWKAPTDIRTTTDGRATYAYLGKIPYRPGKFVTIETYHIKDARRLNALMVDWRAVEPAKISLDVQYTVPGNNSLFSTLFNRPISPFTPSFIVSPEPDIRFRLGDSVRQIAVRLNNPRYAYNYQVVLTRKTDNHRDEINFNPTNTDIVLQKPVWSEPGEYEISFTPRLVKHGGRPVALLRDQTRSIRFTVLPPLNAQKLFSERELLLIVAALLIPVVLIILFLRRRHRRKLAQEKGDKEQIALQLNGLRAQLNPHFLYNALAGIQNLMNQEKIDAANRYLARFARLTRSMLEEQEAGTISLDKEIRLLDDYLAMEQLRFPFQYTIGAGEGIDPEQLEIPAMLVQPFVENAVKHGIAGRKSGHVTIEFTARKKDLVISIRDNGVGFDPAKSSAGTGNRLTAERIRLYNRLYKATAISLNTHSDKNGTLITLVLNDWI